MSSFEDTPAKRYYTTGARDFTTEPIGGGTHTDTVKISHSNDIVVSNKTIENYFEDAIDIVAAAKVVIANTTLLPYGVNGVTVKGASEDIAFPELLFWFHGRESDICVGDFDNYWYPGRSRCKRLEFSGNGMVDGTEVVIRLVDCCSCEIECTFPHRFVVVPKWKWYPYFIFRYAQIRAINLWRRFTHEKPIDTTRYIVGTNTPE